MPENLFEPFPGDGRFPGKPSIVKIKNIQVYGPPTSGLNPPKNALIGTADIRASEMVRSDKVSAYVTLKPYNYT